jgi:hypothetical protein
MKLAPRPQETRTKLSALVYDYVLTHPNAKLTEVAAALPQYDERQVHKAGWQLAWRGYLMTAREGRTVRYSVATYRTYLTAKRQTPPPPVTDSRPAPPPKPWATPPRSENTWAGRIYSIVDSYGGVADYSQIRALLPACLGNAKMPGHDRLRALLYSTQQLGYITRAGRWYVIASQKQQAARRLHRVYLASPEALAADIFKSAESAYVSQHPPVAKATAAVRKWVCGLVAGGVAVTCLMAALSWAQ